MSLRIEAVGDALVLTIDRPATRNAIDSKLARKLGQAIRLASRDPSVRGVVLAATGSDVFVSGGDLKELGQLVARDGDGAEVLEMFADLSACETADVPVIAAVQGDVFGGGCELLLLCDMVFLEEQASLCFRHARMGLTPAWGGMSRLVERVGAQDTARLLFTADPIGAAEALRIGLVSEIAPPGQARERAIARVHRIASHSRGTIAAMKRALRAVREARRGATGELERAAFSERWGQADHRAAMQGLAFGRGKK